jgi:hypothetical protein
MCEPEDKRKAAKSIIEIAFENSKKCDAWSDPLCVISSYRSAGDNPRMVDLPMDCGIACVYYCPDIFRKKKYKLS